MVWHGVVWCGFVWCGARRLPMEQSPSASQQEPLSRLSPYFLHTPTLCLTMSSSPHLLNVLHCLTVSYSVLQTYLCVLHYQHQHQSDQNLAIRHHTIIYNQPQKAMSYNNNRCNLPITVFPKFPKTVCNVREGCPLAGRMHLSGGLNSHKSKIVERSK